MSIYFYFTLNSKEICTISNPMLYNTFATLSGLFVWCSGSVKVRDTHLNWIKGDYEAGAVAVTQMPGFSCYCSVGYIKLHILIFRKSLELHHHVHGTKDSECSICASPISTVVLTIS